MVVYRLPNIAVYLDETVDIELQYLHGCLASLLAGKLVPLAFGIKKLTIMCTVEDDKVSVEELTEKIEANEEYVQSVDIAAFNKI